MDVEKMMAEFYSLADPDISLPNLVAGIMMLKSDKGLHDEMALFAASRIPQETAMLAMTRGEEYMNSIPAHILFSNGTMKVNIPETSLFVMGKGGSA